MSYKANQEKLSVTNTGKVQSATQADTATTATTATTAQRVTSEVYNDYVQGTPYPAGSGANGTKITPVSVRTPSASARGFIEIQTAAYEDNNYEYFSNLQIGNSNQFEVTRSYLSFYGDYVPILAIRSGFIPPLVGTDLVWFMQNSPYALKLGGGSWGAISDSRLKTNVRELGSALEKIDALHPVHFEFINSGENANPSGTRTGFIAQEFEQVLPGHTFEMEPMVDADKALLGEGVKAKGIDADLVPYLVKAIQELKAEVDSLKSQLAAIQG
jgi:hypothetical protein